MLKTGFVTTMSGRWPRELPEKRFREYGDFLRATLGDEAVVAAPALVDGPDALALAIDCFRKEGVELVVMVYGAFTGDDVPCAIAQELRVPIVLWAPTEPPFDGGRLLANALVAATMNAASLGRLGHTRHFIYGGLDDGRSVSELKALIRAYAVIKRLGRTMLGLFGYRPTAFYNSTFDEGLIRRTFGVRMEETDLKVVFDLMDSLPEDAVNADVKAVSAAWNVSGVPDGYLPNHSRLYLALKQLMAQQRYDYATLKCWPEMGSLKTTPCAVMGRLADEGHIIGCEGDVDAMLALMAQNMLTGKPGFVTDMINIDEKENTLTYWHCGQPAPSLVDASQPCAMCNHPLAGQGTALWASLKEGPVTSARFCNIDGEYKLFISSGTAVSTVRNTPGAMINVRIGTPVREFIHEVVRKSVPHHYSLMWGDVADDMKLIAGLLGLEIIDLS